MTTTMPALNGVQPSPSSSQSTTTKRKRADSHQPSISDASHNRKQSADSIPNTKLGESIQAIYYVLKSHDTTPSILHHSIPLVPDRNGSDDNESAAKRTKLSLLPASESISTKIQNEAYKSLEELASDVEACCSNILAQARLTKNVSQWEYAPSTLNQDRLIAKVMSFQELANTLLYRELARTKFLSAKHDTREHKMPKEESSINGVKEEADTNIVQIQTIAPDSRTVLTLFGNAQGHKQLFSSFQRPVGNKDEVEEQKAEDSIINSMKGAIVPIRENGLPNGISSSRVIPVSQKTVSAASKSDTVLDVFGPPASTLPLVPPKTPRPGLGRQNSVTWTQGNVATMSKNMIGYAHQKLAAGQWLGYDGVIPSRDAASPESKRKQRDRTLSTGESGSAPSEVTAAAQTQAKEEALFRSVYSSFAPCRDNTGAIFSEEARNQIWWQKVGSRYMEDVFPTDINPAAPLQLQVDPALEKAEDDDEDLAFRKVIEQFEPSVPVVNRPSETTTAIDKDGDALLQDVSEMLEVLHSYQRIRNSCLNTTARSSVGQNTSLQDLMGSPSVPSSAEIETYEALKAQLSLIVSLLPPYAVAKLNGEQLEELQISQRMLMETPSFRGVMEDDRAARVAKAAAFNAAVGSANVQSRQNAMLTPAALQYSTGQARTAQMTAASRSNTQQYYAGAPPSLSRQSSSFSRQSLSAWQTPAQSYVSPTTQRPAYATQQSFSHQQTPRAAPNTIRPPISQYPQSRSSSTIQQVNGSYPSTTPSQPAYQQRAQNYASNTNYNFKPSYNAAAYNAAQNNQQQQYSRGSYLLSQPQPPPQSVSPAPVAGGLATAPRPPTPSLLGQMNMGVTSTQSQAQPQAQTQTQMQSPGVALPASMTVGGESQTPQS